MESCHIVDQNVELNALKLQWIGNSDRSVLPYCDAHPSVTDYRKIKIVVICIGYWFDFEMWVLHSEVE